MAEETKAKEPVLSIEEMNAKTAELDLELKRAQLEELKLQREERTLGVQDLKARLADRATKDLQTKLDREAQGRTFAMQKATDDSRQAACTHKKGGIVSPRDMRALSTGGNGQQYAVFKHQMINGDIWVRCLRCGKTWAPPIKENFYFNKDGVLVAIQDGVFDAVAFAQAEVDYRRAVNFETNNSMSGSVQCRFTRKDPVTKKMVDATDEVRDSMASTTLR